MTLGAVSEESRAVQGVRNPVDVKTSQGLKKHRVVFAFAACRLVARLCPCSIWTTDRHTATNLYILTYPCIYVYMPAICI